MKHKYSIPTAKLLRCFAVFAVGFIFALLTCGEAKAASPDSADNNPSQESLFPHKSFSLSGSHFTWGAEVGSSLDMTSHDLSTFDVDVLLGYKNSLISVAGLGTGIHRSINSGSNFIPLYAVLRTGFTRKPSPFFLNIQTGFCFSRIGHSGTGGHAGNEGQSSTIGDFYSALGIGVKLNNSGIARPYVILSAACQRFNDNNQTVVEIDSKYIFFAKVVIGVNF